MLSAQAHDRLSHLLAQAVESCRSPWTPETLLHEIEAILAQPLSFADAIIENGQARQKCELGKWHSVYRIGWRKAYPVVLKLFREHGAMTTAHVGNLFRGAMAATVRKCPSELVHFGLLETCGSSKGDTVYRLTTFALDFLDGRAPVPEYVWPRDVELPEECQDGPKKYLAEIEAAHAGQDRARHVQDAFSVLSEGPAVTNAPS